MAKVIDIADAVVAELNGPGAPGFSQSFTAARINRPRFELADLKTVRVSVVPKAVSWDALSRSGTQDEYAIDVGVQKAFGQDEEQATTDASLTLVEEIARFFLHRRLENVPAAVCVRAENAPIWSAEHADELRAFTSVLTLTFRVVG